MNRKLYKHEDNAYGRLNAGISAGTLAIPLQSGQGALLPATCNGSATSSGSSTALNSTGIQAAFAAVSTPVVVGDIIENVTDGSYAIIKSISTNAIVTTRLKGGTDNTWQNSDVWAVNRFIVTLVKYEADGETVVRREKVLIESRSGDNLTVNASGRGFDGSTAASFDASDYVYLYMTSCALDGIQQAIAQAYLDIDTLSTATENVAYTNASNSWSAAQSFTADLLQITSDADSANDPIRKSYLDAELATLTDEISGYVYGDGSDGALSITSGTTTLNTANKQVYQYTSLSITGTGALAFGSNLTNKPIFVLVQGDLTVTSSATPAVDARGLGGAGASRNTSAFTGTVGTDGYGTYEWLTSGQGAGAGGSFTGSGGGATYQASGGAGGGGIGNDGSAPTAGGGSFVPATGKGGRYNASMGIAFRILNARCGSGGGSGGRATYSYPSLSGIGYGGAGGAGGGCVIFIVGGNINITGVFNASGSNGENGESVVGGSSIGGAGGGGGGGGFVGVYYSGSVTANTATFTVAAGSAGAGGTGGYASGYAGAAGGAGQSDVRKIQKQSKLVLF